MSLIEPTVIPEYSKRARIVEVDRLVAGIGLKRDSLAREAGIHPNTLNSVLRGNSVQYSNAHAVFTVLNSMWQGSHSRRKHVHYLASDESWKEDEALDNVFTFPRLVAICRDHKIKDDVLARQAGLARAYLEIIKARRPVARNLCSAVFDALKRYDPNLVKEEELIP